ncbi:MAG: protein phosphatase 2C domain-containing protein [Muribaculaceae bacterium]|nr:protein phosphatase 2C domain-containing protein [Muribaculaceae bacterium]
MEVTLHQPYSFMRQGKRDNQEDYRYPNEDAPSALNPVFVLCDGVGGNNYGEVASQTVANTLGQVISAMDLSQGLSGEHLSDALGRAYDALDERAVNAEYREMSTTMALLVIHGRGVTMAHLGDSRIYQFRPSQGIIYRSEDHSLVNDYVRKGYITPHEAINHPQGNVITRCLSPTLPGQPRDMATMVCTDDVEPGDYFLLCSDGVLHGLSDDQLATVLLNESMSDELKLNQIAQMCENSDDNNTAILIPVCGVMRDDEPGGTSVETDRTSEPLYETREIVDHSEIEEVAPPRRLAKESWTRRLLKRVFGRILPVSLVMFLSWNLPSAQNRDLSHLFDDLVPCLDTVCVGNTFVDSLQNVVAHGDSSAMMLLWQSYMRGDSVARDYDHALQWMAVAFAHGYRNDIQRMMCGELQGIDSPFRQYVLGMKAFMVDKDLNTACQLFEQVEKQGIADGIAMQALIMASNRNPKKNVSKAVKMLEDAIEHGSNAAYYYLGRLYESGTVTAGDPEKALDLLEAAALNGHAAAQCHLGEKYFEGNGVNINLIFAFEYYEMANRQMQLSPQAARHMKRCYEMHAGDVHRAEEIARCTQQLDEVTANNWLSAMLSAVDDKSID